MKEQKNLKIDKEIHDYLKIRAAKENKKIYELIREIVKKEIEKEESQS